MQVNRKWTAICGYSTALIVYFRFMEKAQELPPRTPRANPDTAKKSKGLHSRSLQRVKLHRIESAPTPEITVSIMKEESEKVENIPWYKKKFQQLFFATNVDYRENEDDYYSVQRKHNLLLFLWTLHYGRRLFETLFINEFKTKESIIGPIIACGYYGLVAWMNAPKNTIKTIIKFNENKYNNNNKPKRQRTYLHKYIAYLGICTYMFGEIGNGYHHYLLSQLKNEALDINNNSVNRSNNNIHVMPHGGLFEYVSTPHYFFELITWFGWSILNSFSRGSMTFFVGSTAFPSTNTRPFHVVSIANIERKRIQDSITFARG